MATTDHNDIIGRGWSFPPTFRAGSADVLMTTGTDDIQGSLHILLSTSIGERVMQPLYGCNLRRFLFEPANLNLQAYIKKIVEEAILYFEPRIRAENITLEVDDGTLNIGIEYTVKSTNSRYNFVYPFYIREGRKA